MSDSRLTRPGRPAVDQEATEDVDLRGPLPPGMVAIDGELTLAVAAELRILFGRARGCSPAEWPDLVRKARERVEDSPVVPWTAALLTPRGVLVVLRSRQVKRKVLATLRKLERELEKAGRTPTG